MKHKKRPQEILLVEDNTGDVILIQESMREINSTAHLNVAKSGGEALAFLHRETPFTHAPCPDLILLDLNLPRMNGHEVLARIRADEKLKHIPVIILTTSEATEDIRQAYELHANSYVTKPADLDTLFHTIAAIEEFWLSVAVGPPTDEKAAVAPGGIQTYVP